ncbi:MAG: hypothetical protein H7840_10805 [Alphaproteobacteria bacterium]
MSDNQETVTEIDKFVCPWGKEITLKAVDFDSGLKFIRVTIREKSRFTMLDLDVDTAEHFARELLDWAGKAREAMKDL